MAPRQLTSKSTFFAKWVFLALWGGIGLYATLAHASNGAIGTVESITFFAFGVVIWWLSSSRLMDRVIDLGDHLELKRGFKTTQISIATIVHATYSGTQPATIVLRLDQASVFGSTIAFIPIRTGGGLFEINPLADELMRRSSAMRDRLKAL